MSHIARPRHDSDRKRDQVMMLIDIEVRAGRVVACTPPTIAECQAALDQVTAPSGEAKQ